MCLFKITIKPFRKEKKNLKTVLPFRQQCNAMLVGLDGNRHSSNSLAGMERIRLELLSILAFFTNYSFLQRNNNKH